MPKEKAQSMFFTRAQVVPSTLDEDKRTIDVVFATDTPVRRYDPRNGTDFDEVLVFTPQAMRMERIQSGPLLDNHNKYEGVKGVLGRVVKARIENGQGVATIRFSKKASVEEIWQDVKDNILPNLSVGYIVYEYERTVIKDGEIPTYRATDWEPMEISLAVIPADPKAQVRAEEDPGFEYKVILSPNQTREMEKEPIVVETPPTPPQAPVAPVVVAPGQDEAGARAIAEAAVVAERGRVKDITTACRAAGLDDIFTRTLVDSNVDINQARAKIIEQFAAADPHKDTRGVNAFVGADRETEGRRSAMVDALTLRSGMGDEVAVIRKDDNRMRALNPFRGLSLIELARKCLEQSGIRTEGMSRMDVAGHALGMIGGRAHSSTADFPIILQNVMHKVLQSQYQSIEDTWRQFCAVGTCSDFRPNHRYRTGALGNLVKVLENGNYETLALGDGETESISVDTYGKIINISRKMLVNDDMGAFLRLAGDLGRSAKRTIEVAVYALLAENSGLGPTMSDGKALFHTDHANIGTGAALSIASLSADKTLMAKQKEPGGQDFLGIRPSVILLSIELEDQMKVYNESQYDVDASQKTSFYPNRVRGLFTKIVGSPRLSGTRRYMFADASVAPCLEVDFLDGVQEPYMEMQTEFANDGVQWKVRHDFGIAAIDFRGGFTNAGA